MFFKLKVICIIVLYGSYHTCNSIQTQTLSVSPQIYRKLPNTHTPNFLARQKDKTIGVSPSPPHIYYTIF
jgi:hypothetical protein